jgi:hypothetical protein
VKCKAHDVGGEKASRQAATGDVAKFSPPALMVANQQHRRYTVATFIISHTGFYSQHSSLGTFNQQYQNVRHRRNGQAWHLQAMLNKPSGSGGQDGMDVW